MEGPSNTPDAIDVGRLKKPEADAFRYIASALGARFAGDPSANASAAPNPDIDDGVADDAQDTTWEAAAPSRLPVAAHAQGDPKRARLLDRVPVPIVVVDDDRVAFLNKTALATLGYGSAALLEAAGGLTTLLGARSSGREATDGAVLVRAATGVAFSARVEMAPIEWGFSSALMLSIIPVEAPQRTPPATRRALAGDPLVALLDANPDPVALVTRWGAVETCNKAFAALGPSDRHVVRLDERLGPADTRHLLETIALSFAVADGAAETAWPVHVRGKGYWASVGALGPGPLACVVLHEVAEKAGLRQPCPTERFVAIAEAAVSAVRRLIGEAAVLLIHRPGGDGAVLSADDEDAVTFLRSALLTVAARAPIGSVMVLESGEAGITLRVTPARLAAEADLFGPLLASERLRALGARAGLTVDVRNGLARMAGDPATQRRTG